MSATNSREDFRINSWPEVCSGRPGSLSCQQPIVPWAKLLWQEKWLGSFHSFAHTAELPIHLSVEQTENLWNRAWVHFWSIMAIKPLFRVYMSRKKEYTRVQPEGFAHFFWQKGSLPKESTSLTEKPPFQHRHLILVVWSRYLWWGEHLLNPWNWLTPGLRRQVQGWASGSTAMREDAAQKNSMAHVLQGSPAESQVTLNTE